MAKHRKRKRGFASRKDPLERHFDMLASRAKPRLDMQPPLQQAYHTYAAEMPPEPTTSHLVGLLGKRIAEVVSPRATDRAPLDLRRLERILALRRLIEGRMPGNAELFLKVLLEATRTLSWRTRPLADEASWSQALSMAWDIARLSGLSASTYADGRVQVISENAIILRRAGFEVSVEGPNVNVAQLYDAVVPHIDKLAKRAGGLRISEWVFRDASKYYNVEQRRYNIVRRGSPMMLQPAVSAVPYGYLLNLAAKHLGCSSSEDAADAIDDLIRIATAFCAIHDAQPFNVWELLHWKDDRVIDALSELVMFDTFFQFPQLDIRCVPSLIDAVFSWVDTELHRRAFKCDRDTLRAILEAIVSAVHDTIGCAVITSTEVATAVDLPEATIETILSLFTHPGGVNRAYRWPLSMTDVTHWRRPFFRVDNGFLLLDSSFAAHSFFEALADELRPIVKNADQRFGEPLEEMLRSELQRSGVTVSSGEYRSSVGEGQCDAVVETSDVILLFELKKKALTRGSRSGDSWALLMDLTKAFIAPQLQAARHELALYEDDVLELSDGSTIVRNGRRVERIAVTFLEFGALHSRDMAVQFLEKACGAVVRADGLQKSELNYFNKRAAKLKMRNARLQDVRPTGKGDSQFFNCWFLSLPQIFTMLRDCESNEQLWAQLRLTRHMTTGSMNWYFDYHSAKTSKLRAQFEPTFRDMGGCPCADTPFRAVAAAQQRHERRRSLSSQLGVLIAHPLSFQARALWRGR